MRQTYLCPFQVSHTSWLLCKVRLLSQVTLGNLPVCWESEGELPGTRCWKHCRDLAKGWVWIDLDTPRRLAGTWPHGPYGVDLAEEQLLFNPLGHAPVLSRWEQGSERPRGSSWSGGGAALEHECRTQGRELWHGQGQLGGVSEEFLQDAMEVGRARQAQCGNWPGTGLEDTVPAAATCWSWEGREWHSRKQEPCVQRPRE